MRIIYIAKHGSPNNDDEGAITFALQKLGHDVLCVKEKPQAYAMAKGRDFALFHHWDDFDAIERIPIPKAFWCFDLVNNPDPALAARSAYRRNWATRLTGICDVGFMTDGDWVANDTSGKLHWLTQGADERVIGFGKATEAQPLLFAGSRGHGTMREIMMDEVMMRYGSYLRIYEGSHRIYRRKLADAIASAKIVIAPESPVSDRYWSNRAYMISGFGGFLLHPYCAGLAKHYEDGHEIVYYRGRQDFFAKVEHYLYAPAIERKRIASQALARTIEEHLYWHRCQELIRIVKESI